MAWTRNAYTCYDCLFYNDRYCEQRDIKVTPDKLPCRDFEMG